MKKLFIAVFLMMLLISNVKYPKEFTLLDYFDGEYACYVNDRGVGLDLGFCSMVDEKIDEECVGESMVIRDLEVGGAIKALDAKVVKTECLDSGCIVLYAYSDKINKSVFIDNKEVNLQIAYQEDYSVIGWPLILGSF